MTQSRRGPARDLMMMVMHGSPISQAIKVAATERQPPDRSVQLFFGRAAFCALDRGDFAVLIDFQGAIRHYAPGGFGSQRALSHVL